ncbi:hypothetical protein FH972_026649 [Carpinus fangiana]|uniref:Pseudouridine synthase I TruA alpha/beta domain-containing protein n=1 Tax=Carpinus fangiana TaxID=176857 RepID=A0A5N6L514_9ROSI|nr:hypothetical protein FH972_026649 [Carpinus fangiana]
MGFAESLLQRQRHSLASLRLQTFFDFVAHTGRDKDCAILPSMRLCPTTSLRHYRSQARTWEIVTAPAAAAVGTRSGSTQTPACTMAAMEVVRARNAIWGVKTSGAFTPVSSKLPIRSSPSRRHGLTKRERSRQNFDRRAQNEEETAKRRKLEESGISVLVKPFTEEEIAQEDRRPKRKVAVMIGYSGSGYKGMQINNTEKTIEGDLFNAFVAAGAISKANANDPKKSALVRCARTDKGVHAAGNVISLKLIVQDEDIVTKINEHLSPQIRVWGITRTVNSFSCYQACDSRWYEYLIPSHAFLPPHPSSWLGRRLKEVAEERGDVEGYKSRQEEVAEFWSSVDEEKIKPLLETMDSFTREKVTLALYDDPENYPDAVPEAATAAEADQQHDADDEGKPTLEEKRAVDAATKALRAAYLAAKRGYRIHPERLARIQPVLNAFLGTKNFHNYTVQKTFSDPSAKRVIKSWKLDIEPKLVGGTEWLSLKIHGQSFMMHQIRKMVGAVALVIRSGCPKERIAETFTNVTVAIPKVPGLGLLLERPVFDSYNHGPASSFDREKLDFTTYEKEMDEFKGREIYERIYREEEDGRAFHSFFAHIDGMKGGDFLWLTSGGVDEVKKWKEEHKGDNELDKDQKLVESDDEGGVGEG